MKEKHYTLTRGEMAVMQVLWDMPTGGTIHEIIDRYAIDDDDPAAKKPAYTTIATFLKILTNKGFVTSRPSETGKARIFSCIITRAMYSKQMMQEMKHGLFGGSIRRMINCFVSEEELTLDELRELLELVD